jgi:hypothetical protein
VISLAHDDFNSWGRHHLGMIYGSMLVLFPTSLAWISISLFGIVFSPNGSLILVQVGQNGQQRPRDSIFHPCIFGSRRLRGSVWKLDCAKFTCLVFLSGSRVISHGGILIQSPRKTHPKGFKFLGRKLPGSAH